MEIINTHTYVDKCRQQISSSFVESSSEELKENITNGRYNYIKTVSKSGEIGLMCPKCFGISSHTGTSAIGGLISQNYKKEVIDTNKVDDDGDLILEPDTVEIIPDIKYMVYQCPHCGNSVTLIEVDPCIIQVVSILNKKGYLTNFSCEGHNETSNPYIYFSNKKQMEKYLHTIPTSWFLDLEDIKEGRFIIRTEFEQKNVAIYELLEWANGLDDADKDDIANTLRARLFDKISKDIMDVYNIESFDNIKDVNVGRMLTDLGYFILGL